MQPSGDIAVSTTYSKGFLMSTSLNVLRTALLAGATLMSLLIASCDSIIDASSIDVPIEVNISGDAVNPSIPSSNDACTDLTTQSAFSDNVARIRGGRVSDVTLKITDLTNPTFTSGTLSTQVFSRVSLTLQFDQQYGDTRVYTLGEFTNVSLADLMSQPRSLVLHGDANDAIGKMISQPKFCVTVSYGSLASGPASADYIRATLAMTLAFEARTL